MAPPTVNRWIRPEVYPLFAALGVAVGICGFQLVRNICFNPEVRYIYLSLSTCHTHTYVCVGSGSSYDVIEDLDPFVYVLINITVFMFMESVHCGYVAQTSC
ncbi:hypothetical protein RHMOL_Rhmol08G0070800 [Rhododendron molle]|uniref:Uncharacterized protein n=1 Tax=Rhododendron molle TaxID=49168 RepID=A0ACC0MKN5_RHOML|nr:hypothetical protein RHMOL_Rhmol08G0070800 [Rhododendron molle]